MLNKYVLCFVSMAIIYLYCYKLSKKKKRGKKEQKRKESSRIISYYLRFRVYIKVDPSVYAEIKRPLTD